MTYYVTNDEEHWSTGPYDTREEAIAAGPAEFDLKPGQKLWTGADCGVVDTYGPYSDRVIEDAQERAFDENGDCAEMWLDGVTAEQHDELDKALDEVWEAWLDKHGLRPKWFLIDNIEEHVYDGSDLHVFAFKSSDFVIARDGVDAACAYRVHTGDWDKEWDPDVEGARWTQQPDDLGVTVAGDDGPVTKTCGEWAKGGRGFLCSTEY